MKKILNLFVVVVIVCMLIAFYTVKITAYANEDVSNECVQCGKLSDVHGGAIKVEQDGELLIFCCPNCIDKHKKRHHGEYHKDDKHDSHKNHDKQ